jgi:hypothetical protein
MRQAHFNSSILAFISFSALSISKGRKRPVTEHLEESRRNSFTSDLSKKSHITVAVGKLIVTFFERLVNRIFTTDIVRFLATGPAKGHCSAADPV